MASRKPYSDPRAKFSGTNLQTTLDSLSVAVVPLTNNTITHNATNNFIGINKTTPISQLDVVGDVRAFTSDNSSGVLLTTSGGVYASSKVVLGTDLTTLNTGVDGPAGGKLEIKTLTDGEYQSTAKVTINNAGAIGLGNSTPIMQNGNQIGLGPNYGTAGQVLTSQGTSPPIYAYTPAPSLSSASFALAADTGDLVSGTTHTISGNYDTISAVGGNFITNGNDGTFTINTGGVYQIHFTLAMSKTSTGSFLRAGRCKLSKNNNIDLVQNHFLDSVSEMHEVSPSVNYLGSFADNDVIKLRGQSNFSGSNFKALGIAGTIQRTYIHFIKLS